MTIDCLKAIFYSIYIFVITPYLRLVTAHLTKPSDKQDIKRDTLLQ